MIRKSLEPLTREEIVIRFNRLIESIHYNGCMYRHYRNLFQQRRRSWHFVAAAFAYSKMCYYEKKMAEAQLKNMLQEVNFKNDDRPVIVISKP